jgi:cyclic pyranopterin phosphate synthase
VRGGAGDDALAGAIRGIWQGRATATPRIRTAATAASRKVEMSFIGG